MVMPRVATAWLIHYRLCGNLPHRTSFYGVQVLQGGKMKKIWQDDK
jgi:hypothetical protein